MQQEERNSIPFQLMDGRVLDVFTENGANTFLQAGSESKDHLANNVKRMSKICSKRRLNVKDRSDLNAINWFFFSISARGSLDVFRQNVEQSTIKAWLGHVIEQIKRCSRNRNWITTGTLPPHETSLLQSCLAMMFHAVPVALAFGSEFFTVLADLVKARKGTDGRALPCVDICHTITLIVANAYGASKIQFDNKWTTEKALKSLEATGVLEQFIRCATVPQPSEAGAAVMFEMLDEFLACLPFINKKVRPGQPCGDVIIAILEGRDGSKVERPTVLNRLKTMIRFASSIDPHHKCTDGNKVCRNCGKLDNSEALMKCGRCQEAYYCSKECQKADWKSHKNFCVPKTKKELVVSENLQQTLMSFCQRQHSHIMVKMVEACEQTGLSKNDMLVEVNLTANENGIVPAMQDKPEFKIAPVKDYIEGSRPAEPDWFDKKLHRENYDYNIKGYLAMIREGYSKVQSDQLLFLVRFGAGVFVQVHGFHPTVRSEEVVSQEAVLAFKAYMNDDDDGPLSAMFSPEKLLSLKLELFEHYGYGRPEEMMRALRRLPAR